MISVIGWMPPLPMHGVCRLCSWEGPERPDTQVAQQDAVWHVYEEHRDEWVKVIGDRPPERPKPAA